MDSDGDGIPDEQGMTLSLLDNLGKCTQIYDAKIIMLAYISFQTFSFNTLFVNQWSPTDLDDDNDGVPDWRGNFF